MYQAANNPSMLRDYNLATVYSLVRDQGPISRAEISRETGISKSTVSGLVDHLQSEALICEVGVSRNHIGRRSLLLDIDTNGSHVIGVFIANEGLVRTVVADGRGSIKRERAEQCESADQLVPLMTKHVESLSSDFKIRSIGIAAPGLVQETGIAFALKLRWRNLPLAAPLEDATGIPVFVESIGRSSLLAERWWGVGRSLRSFFQVGHHNTMGASYFLDGVVFRGVNGVAGEFGHVRVSPDGPRCICGRKGCLTTLASLKAIKQRCGMEPEMDNTDFAQFAVANQSEPRYRKVLEDAADYIANALADVVNVLDPGYVVLNSALSDCPVFVERLEKTLLHEVMDQSTQGVKMVTSDLGEDAFILGSCAVGLQGSLEPKLGRISAL